MHAVLWLNPGTCVILKQRPIPLTIFCGKFPVCMATFLKGFNY